MATRYHTDEYDRQYNCLIIEEADACEECDPEEASEFDDPMRQLEMKEREQGMPAAFLRSKL